MLVDRATAQLEVDAHVLPYSRHLGAAVIASMVVLALVLAYR